MNCPACGYAMGAFEHSCPRCNGKRAPEKQSVPPTAASQSSHQMADPIPPKDPNAAFHSRFCPHCSAPMSVMMQYCPSCRKKNTAPTGPLPPEPTPIWGKVAGIGAVVVVLFFGLIFALGGPVKRASGGGVADQVGNSISSAPQLTSEEQHYYTTTSATLREMTQQCNFIWGIYEKYTPQDRKAAIETLQLMREKQEIALNRFRSVNVPKRFVNVDARLREGISYASAGCSYGLRFADTLDFRDKQLAMDNFKAASSVLEQGQAEFARLR
jgi:RNA polymerase subunit RPABC4/transcription elongation factor Spt4